jgi:hypothetical protein
VLTNQVDNFVLVEEVDRIGEFKTSTVRETSA